jgi:hypothetical protein
MLDSGDKEKKNIHFKGNKTPAAYLYNTIRGTIQSDSADQKDKEEHNWQSHGDICDSPGPLHAKGEAEPNTDPHNNSISDILGNDPGRTQISTQGLHSNDLIVKVADCIFTSDTLTKRI